MQKLPNPGDARDAAAQNFEDQQGNPTEVVRIPKNAFKTGSVRPVVSPENRAIPLEIRFNPDSNLGDLVAVLSSLGMQVGFRWDSATGGQDILTRKLPFLRYAGTFGGLLDSLRTGLGVVSWQENGVIFLSDTERYSVTLPQNQDVMDAIAKEIGSLGGASIVTSMRGGNIIYSARPTVQDDLIGPFLDRTTKNLSMIRVQVAIVNVTMSDESSVGFDWNAFSLRFDSRSKAMSAPPPPDPNSGSNGNNGNGNNNNNNTTTNNTTSTAKLPAAVPLDSGNVFDATGSALALGKTSLGRVFGAYGALSVSSAVNFLSNFGKTKVAQNVELSTLSGSEVKLRSGQVVPYVKGVGVNTSGNSNNSNNSLGSTQTDTVETGLTVHVNPYYDASVDLVTLGINVEMKTILEFVELKAGNQIGSLTQPLTQDQSLENIVRVSAGRTVVIGGLQNDSEQGDGVEPIFLRKGSDPNSVTFGKKAQKISRSALFLILRPTLTIFVPEDK